MMGALRRARSALTTVGLLSMPVGWLALFFVVPAIFVAQYSLGLLSLFPSEHILTVDAWKSVLLHDSVYRGLFFKSARMSLIVSVFCILFAYPLAYFLAFGSGRRKYVHLILLIAPFWTSYLLRVLAWKVILGDQGVVNSFAYWVGLRPQGNPIPQLLYSQFSVMLVLAYVWIPFVALPIFVTLEGQDSHLLEAASDLGASRWQAFRYITFRLSVPGLVAAFLFVFIPTIGEFITPLLVGGPRGFMIGNAIQSLFGAGLDWQTGSTLALLLLAVLLVLILVASRFARLQKVLP